MKIAVLKERRDAESRVAVSPEVAGKLVALGFEVSFESGAGIAASFSDEAYVTAGATVIKNIRNTLKRTDILLKVLGPTEIEIGKIKKNTIVIANLGALTDHKMVEALAKAGITSFAMELMPRISRAQSMDILSSQSNLAGYKAVLDAASEFGRAFPMMMTAAGTVAPAKVFIMGVGVAGLQAIATAKRMGAVVTATDVRPATKEQVESLGGKFLEIDAEMEKEAQTKGGYAKQMPPEYLEKQKKIVEEHIKKQDIVITTALIPGKKAPILVTKAMADSMPMGGVLVDLAVESGGNCEYSKIDEIVITPNSIRIVGHRNVAGRLAQDASSLYARNLLNFVTPHINKEKGILEIDWQDEVIKGTLVTKDGDIVNKIILEKIKVSRPSNEKTVRKKGVP